MDSTPATFYDANSGKSEKRADPNVKSRRTALKTWSRYVRARDAGHTEYIRNAKKYDKFYVGDQWDEQDLQSLQASGRPALTINKILPTVNAVLGEQAAKRANITYKHRKDGDALTAEVLQKIAHVITDNNAYEHKEGMMFADGMIQDRGFLEIRISQKENIQGDVDIQVRDPLEVVLDSDAKDYDPSTWKEVFTTSWISMDDVEDRYGKEKANEIRDHFGNFEGSWDADAFDIKNINTFGENSYMEHDFVQKDEKYNIRSVRLISHQQRRMTKCWFFVDPQTYDESMVPSDWPKERREAFAEKFGMGLYSKNAIKIRWTHIAGDAVTLHDDWSPYKTFTIIPYFPYFRRGKPFGVVKNLLSPQEQLNKLESQELHIVNTTANSGWKYEEGALVDMDDSDLRETGSQTGLVIKTAPGRLNDVEKIQPNQIPTGVDRLSQKSSANVKEISAVSDAMLGFERADASAKLMERKEERGSNQLQKPLDHLAYTRKLVGEKILELIQQYYTEERVFRIVDFRDMQQQEEELVINMQDAAGNIINDLSLGKYDCVVSTTPARDSWKENQFEVMMALKHNGVMVPDDSVVEYSPLHRSEEIAEKIRQLMGTAEPTEEELAMREQQMAISMEGQMLELQKLGAEIMELQARANLQAAKANTEDAGRDEVLDKIEAEVQVKRDEYALRKELALIAALSKERIADDDNATAILVEKIKGSNRPAPRSGADTP